MRAAARSAGPQTEMRGSMVGLSFRAKRDSLPYIQLTLRRARRIIALMTLRFRVHVEQDEDGVFVVECSNLPGCISQGKTRAEALTNIRDAILGYLASLEKHGEPIPLSVQEEIVEIRTA
jgi:predicted RNase H-like HicB family nuclease